MAFVVVVCQLFSKQKVEGSTSFQCVWKMCLNTKVVGVLAEVIDRHFRKKNLEVPTLEYKSCCYCGEWIERHFPKE